MPHIILPDRWRKPPAHPVKLNGNNYFARDLAIVFDPVGARNVVSGAQLTVSGTKLQAISTQDYGALMARGFGSTYGVATSDVITSDVYFWDGPRTYSFIVDRRDAGGNGFGRILAYGSLRGDLFYFSNDTSLRMTGSNSSGVDYTRISGVGDWAAPTLVRLLTVASDGTATAGTMDYFDRGLELSTAGHSTNPNPGVLTDPLYIGNDSALTRHFGGFLSWGWVWKRKITPAEISGYWENPWQMLARDIPRTYFFPASVGIRWLRIPHRMRSQPL